MRPLILIPALLCATVFSALTGWKLSSTSMVRQRVVAKKVEKTTISPPVCKVSVPVGNAAVAMPGATPSAAAVEEQSDGSLLQQRGAALKQAATVRECRQLSRALAAMGGEDAADAIWLAAAAQKNPELRAAILEGFDSVTDPAMITFSASVLKATSDHEIIKAAVKLISRGADSDTVSFLSELYHEANTTETQRDDIEESLRLIHNEPAIPALGLLARHSEQPRLAHSAILALSTLGTSASLVELEEAQKSLATIGETAQPLLAAIAEARSIQSSF